MMRISAPEGWAAHTTEAPSLAVWPIFIALGLLAAFLIVRTVATIFLALAPPFEGYLVVFVGASLAAIIGRNVHATEASGLFARLSGATALGLVLYLLVEPTRYVAIRPDTEMLALMLRIGDFVALAGAVVGLRRPTFLIIPAVHVIAARLLVDDVSGLSMAKHDVLYLAEAGIFMALGALVLRSLVQARPAMSEDVRRELTYCVAFVAIGFHLANYFWSGIAKLILDGEPFEWLLTNDLSKLLVVAIEKGVAPLGGVPTLAQIAHDALSSGSIFFNGFVLVIQLLAIISVVRLVWLRIGAVCYDLLHIGVYIFGGILFWPWIWMNGAVLWAMHGEGDRSVGAGPKVCAAISILACGLPVLGAASWLDWYDVADTRITTVEAQVRGSSDWTPVPLSFFGAHAYSVSHGFLDQGERAGHFAANVPGLTYESERRGADGSCTVPQAPAQPEAEIAREERLARFDAFMRAHHRAAQQDVAWFGRHSYYFRFHHHPSNPLLHRNFHAIDINDIVRYRLVTRSVCLELNEGHISRRLLKEDAHVVEIR